jgi:lipopolysaccharide transport system ATP-binding protein
VRLAFAVAAHLEPEILVVDEVLAVGDAEFQKKCLGKMKDVSDREGRTVLFVSHNMAAVSNLCNRVVVLNQGATIFNGETKSGINTYLNYLNVNKKRGWSRKEDYNSNAYFDNIDIELSGIQPNIVLKIRFSLFFLKKDQSGFVAFDIKNSQGNTIMQAIPKLLPFINYDINIQHYESLVYLNGLIPDTYFVSFWIGPHNTLTYDFIEDVVSFDIIEGPIAERNFPYTLNHGSVVPASEIKKIK